MEKNIITLAKYLYTKGIDSPLKIQKILFFFRYEELKNNQNNEYFKKDKNFQAWIYGPVNLDSFHEMKKVFDKTVEKEEFILEDAEIEEIDKIYGIWFEKYKNYSANELVNKSHKNISWKNARGDLDDDSPCKTYMLENESFLEFE